MRTSCMRPCMGIVFAGQIQDAIAGYVEGMKHAKGGVRVVRLSTNSWRAFI